MPLAADQTIELHAGPAAPNPPLFLAAIIICVSIAAPVLFSMAGAPSILLALAALALAVAGMITLFGALGALRKRRADAAIRRRASIGLSGIAFYRQPASLETDEFARAHIKRAWLAGSALIVDTTPDHPRPGRHRLMFGKLATSRAELIEAINLINAGNHS